MVMQFLITYTILAIVSYITRLTLISNEPFNLSRCLFAARSSVDLIRTLLCPFNFYYSVASQQISSLIIDSISVLSRSLGRQHKIMTINHVNVVGGLPTHAVYFNRGVSRGL